MNLDREFHAAHPEVSWAEIVAMRNVLVHEYFGIDLGEIWKTVENDLPKFKRSVENLLKTLEEKGS